MRMDIPVECRVSRLLSLVLTYWRFGALKVEIIMEPAIERLPDMVDMALVTSH